MISIKERKRLVQHSLVKLSEVAAAHLSEVAWLLVWGAHLEAIRAIAATIITHIKTSFSAEPPIPRVKKNASGVLGVVAQVIPPVKVGVALRVASVKLTRVERLDGNDARTAILKSAHITSLAVSAAAGETAVAVGARPAVLVAVGVVLVRGALGLKTSLSAQVAVNVHTIGTDSEALASHGANEAGVGLVTLGAAFVGDGVDLIHQWRRALMETLLVSAVIVNTASQRVEATLNSRTHSRPVLSFCFCCAPCSKIFIFETIAR